MNGYYFIVGLFLTTLPGYYYVIRAGNHLSEKGKQHQFEYLIRRGSVPDDYFTEEGLFFFRRGKRTVVIPLLYLIGTVIFLIIQK